MQPPKRATKAVLWGGGGLVGVGTVVSIIWSAIGSAETRVTQAHNLDMSEVRSEIGLLRAEGHENEQRIYRELCRIRYRMDVTAGVPNPGGCE